MIVVEFPSGPLEALEDSGELSFFLTSSRRSEILYGVDVRTRSLPFSTAPATGRDMHACGTLHGKFVLCNFLVSRLNCTGLK